MRRVRVGCEFVYVAAVDTPSVFQVEPRLAAPVSVATEAWSIHPSAPVRRYEDLYGNRCVRLVLPDVLGDEAWSRFGAKPPGYARGQAICDHVHDHLIFGHGSSDSRSTAEDVNAAGFGVCRDYAHLANSFCRALNIPARYVFGYLPDLDVPRGPPPMDFAAWMQVWLGDRWWTFDPRNNRPRRAGS